MRPANSLNLVSLIVNIFIYETENYLTTRDAPIIKAGSDNKKAEKSSPLQYDQ